MSKMKVSNMATLQEGAIAWMKAKEDERMATALRREIEDYLISEVIALEEDFEGSQSLALGDIKVKVTGRMNRKVDGDMLETLAREHGITTALDELFKWKPELKMTEWKAASEEITSVLAQAITTTPGRVSFDISTKEGA